MKIGLSDLWRTDGTIDRGPYALIGIVLFALKHNIDRYIASFVFHRPWSLFNYFVQPSEVVRITSMSEQDRQFYAVLLAAALPFICAGVLLTLRRLRSIQLPSWFVIFFFLPFLNLLFFIILSVLPSRLDSEGKSRFQTGRLKRILDRVIPDHPVGSAAMGLLIVLPLTTAATAFCVSLLGNYGWSLFVGVPFSLGLVSVLLHGYHRPRGFGSSILVAALSVAFLGFALAALAIEGAICILMAAPIGIALGIVGGAVGYAMQKRPWIQDQSHRLVLVLIMMTPLLMGAESKSQPEAPLIPVSTAIEIEAPPAKVWNNVVSFSELPAPDSWIFRLGVAYPMRAEIKGSGVGAVRYCTFSTGPFVEPIEVWDEPKLLKFSVTSQPPAMKELSYTDIKAPHLNNYLVSEGGQFLLTELPGGRTRLEGTTWYRHKIWPYPYWQVWSDGIIHRIHLRVLKHIKNLSEQ